MSLRKVIDAYRANLPPGDLEHFRVDALDRIGVPVVFACHRQNDGAQFDAFGYGATEEQALVGVLGTDRECPGRHGPARNRARHRQPQRSAARRGAAAICDPLTLCLPPVRTTRRTCP